MPTESSVEAAAGALGLEVSSRHVMRGTCGAGGVPSSVVRWNGEDGDLDQEGWRYGHEEWSMVREGMVRRVALDSFLSRAAEAL